MDQQNVSQGAQTPRKKTSAQVYFYTMLIGIFTTTTLASWMAPGIITWWYDSPAPTPVSAACVPAIDWAIKMLQRVQLGAVVLGAVFGLFFAFRFRTRPQSNPLS